MTLPDRRFVSALAATLAGIADLAPLPLLAEPVQAGQTTPAISPAVATQAPDAAPWQAQRPARPASRGEAVKHSLYVTMPDQTRLAVDYYLPGDRAEGERLPVLLQQTRYYRSIAERSDPQGSCRRVASTPRYFAERGYAVVVVDVRGTGASFGRRDNEFSPAELDDGVAVLDWIVAQPWSNGRIGAFGVSYVGTSAELLARRGHSALKAVAPVSAGYDFYSDLDFPGGVRNRFFIDNWGALNAALDLGHTNLVPGLQNIAGPCPVEGDDGGVLLAQAQTEHAANANSSDNLKGVEYRDDAALAWPSPYPYQAEIDATGVPVLGLAGWNDSGYARAAINRFLNAASTTSRLVITPGNHGLGYFYAPGVTAPVRSAFDLNAELLAFFDAYVAERDNGYQREPRVRWFTTGADRWDAADAWPAPSQALRLCLSPDHRLGRGDCGGDRELEHAPHVDADSGALTRWNTTMGLPVAYAERSAGAANRLSFTSDALNADLEIMGSPVLDLSIVNTAPDAAYFVYLEEVRADGQAFYLTEGLLRASRSRIGVQPYRGLVESPSYLRRDARSDTAGQKLTLPITLEPVAHRFAAGSRLRIVITASDAAHFDAPATGGQTWRISVGNRGSILRLPVSNPEAHR